jgi:mediator of RNA polymerase II transcription subunit 13
LFSANLFHPIQPPHVRVRRGDGLWDVLPPALPFWEHLGLGPAAGRKNVMAFCIYPQNDDVRSQAALFLNHLGSTYESSKLGSHTRNEQLGDFTDGLVPVPLLEHYTFQTAVRSLREVCTRLGKALASVDWQHNKIPGTDEVSRIDNFVIYMINPFDTVHGVAELCSSFWALYQTYRLASRSPMQPGSRPDIVLQILPIKDVASTSAPIVPSPIFFQKLAREVYDRSPPANPDASPSRLKVFSAACIQLEQPPPKSIQFKINTDPSPDMMHENSHFHLSYARSKGGDWITAAWTDNTGRYQATISYCTIGRGFFEVAKEMWNTSIDIMLGRRVVWRFCVAKVGGGMEREEIDGLSLFLYLLVTSANRRHSLVKSFNISKSTHAHNGHNGRRPEPNPNSLPKSPTT